MPKTKKTPQSQIQISVTPKELEFLMEFLEVMDEDKERLAEVFETMEQGSFFESETTFLEISQKVWMAWLEMAKSIPREKSNES